MIGPGVYEIVSDIDEMSEYKGIDISVGVIYPDSTIEVEDIDKYYFTYCREAQGLLNTVIEADKECEYGPQMTIYCGLLEHLSSNDKKEPEVIDAIDHLINQLDEICLGKENRRQLKNHLNNGKNKSATQRCIDLCKRFAHPQYGEYTVEDIIHDAYRIRSAYSHGKNKVIIKESVAMMKYVVLDVIMNYCLRKEEPNETQHATK